MKSLYQNFYFCFYAFGKRNFGRNDFFSIWVVFLFLKIFNIIYILSFFNLKFISYNRYSAISLLDAIIIDYYYLLRKSERIKLKKIYNESNWYCKNTFLSFMMLLYISITLITMFLYSFAHMS